MVLPLVAATWIFKSLIRHHTRGPTLKQFMWSSAHKSIVDRRNAVCEPQLFAFCVAEQGSSIMTRFQLKFLCLHLTDKLNATGHELRNVHHRYKKTFLAIHSATGMLDHVPKIRTNIFPPSTLWLFETFLIVRLTEGLFNFNLWQVSWKCWHFLQYLTLNFIILFPESLHCTRFVS